MSQALDKRGSCLVHYPYLVYLVKVKSLMIYQGLSKTAIAKISIAKRLFAKIQIVKIQGNLGLEKFKITIAKILISCLLRQRRTPHNVAPILVEKRQ